MQSHNEQKLPGNTTLPSSPEALAALINADQGSYKYSVEDFFKNPEKTGYQLSPDGQYFSYLAPFERRMNIFVQKIGAKEAVQITHETDRNIGGYFWKGNNRIVYVKDSGGDENFKLFAVDSDGKNVKDLTPFDQIKIELIDDLDDQPAEIIIGMNKNNPMLFEPYRININNGMYEQIATNGNPAEPITQWITDHDGKLRIAVQMVDGINQKIIYRADEQSDFQEVFTTNFKVSFQPLFFDFDNQHTVFVSSNIGRDKSVIVRYDMLNKKEVGALLFAHDEVDVSQLMYSKKRKVLTGVAYTTWKRHFHFFDTQRADLQATLEKQLPGYEVILASHSKDETKYMVRTYSDKSLGAYYFYDVPERLLSKIVEVGPWIDEAEMAEMQPIEYTSRDGLTIHGYLSLPKVDKPENLPTVILPHGGPWFRDSWGFHPEVLLLTNRGYAVLQVNFRGSTGYGRDFWEKSFKQWGQNMQHDITDGVHWLIEKGITNPDKIAIYGGSYGGYATLAGITFTPDLYCCAIDYVGVSNLFTFMNTIPPYWKPYLETLYEMVGHPERDKEMMAAYSPALHVDKIQVPLFVVQGANDPRVNIDEADQIVASLRNRGIDVPYMVKYNEGHGFQNEENRFEFYKAMTGFLYLHLST
ncbi:MAG: S9 family peptidase [Bacteroidota bacterium]